MCAPDPTHAPLRKTTTSRKVPPTGAPTAAAPRYGTPIVLRDAQAIMAAAEKEASSNGWPVAIAVVDAAGHLIMLQKLDGTQHSSVEVAIGKARTAVNFRRPTKYYEDAIAAGGAGLRFVAMPGMTPFEGGIPIVRDERIVGGIGVSGVRSDMDARIAAAGAAGIVRNRGRTA